MVVNFDFKKNDPHHQPLGNILGTFQLSQDSLEGDYWLVLTLGSRKAVFCTELGGMRASPEEVLQVHLSDFEAGTDSSITGTYSDLMQEALSFLGRFDEIPANELTRQDPEAVVQGRCCKGCNEPFGASYETNGYCQECIDAEVPSPEELDE